MPAFCGRPGRYHHLPLPYYYLHPMFPRCTQSRPPQSFVPGTFPPNTSLHRANLLIRNRDPMFLLCRTKSKHNIGFDCRVRPTNNQIDLPESALEWIAVVGKMKIVISYCWNRNDGSQWYIGEMSRKIGMIWWMALTTETLFWLQMLEAMAIETGLWILLLG